MRMPSTAAALASSMAAHAALLLIVGIWTAPAGSAEDARPSGDQWTGETFELEALLPAAGRGAAPVEPAMGQSAPIRVRAAEAAPAPAPVARAEGEDALAGAASAATRAKPAQHEAKADRVPARPQRPKAASVSSSPAAVASAGDTAPAGAGSGLAAQSGTGAAGGAGAVGQGSVRSLAVAFTRAIPIAVSGDPVWGTLKLGDAGSFDLRIEVDETGRIVSATPSTTPVPDHLQHLVQRTLTFLRAGRFSLVHATVGAGVQVLRVSVLLSEVQGGVPDDDVSAGPYALGFEPPAESKAGRAYFTLRSGRHVEVLVKVVGEG